MERSQLNVFKRVCDLKKPKDGFSQVTACEEESGTQALPGGMKDNPLGRAKKITCSQLFSSAFTFSYLGLFYNVCDILICKYKINTHT